MRGSGRPAPPTPLSRESNRGEGVQASEIEGMMDPRTAALLFLLLLLALGRRSGSAGTQTQESPTSTQPPPGGPHSTPLLGNLCSGSLHRAIVELVSIVGGVQNSGFMEVGLGAGTPGSLNEEN